MNGKKLYYLVYFVTLGAHVLEHFLVIKFKHTLSLDYKLWSTAVKGTALAAAMLLCSRWHTRTWWRAVALVLFSLGTWALVHDAALGFLLYRDIFYLSQATWIDQKIFWFAQGNGLLYTCFKIAVVIHGHYLVTKLFRTPYIQKP